jgi:hypothetical protein
MRIEFEITPDDMVDTTLRALDRSATYRAQRKRNIFVAALFLGVVAFFAFSFVASADSLLARLLVSGFAATVGGVVQFFNERWTIERRMYAYCEEQLGTDEAINFQVELTPGGILTEGQGTKINFAWPNVEEIVETDDTIDFFMRNRGIVVVRKRAFSSAEEQRQFLALAAEYHAQPHSFAEPAPHD